MTARQIQPAPGRRDIGKTNVWTPPVGMYPCAPNKANLRRFWPKNEGGPEKQSQSNPIAPPSTRRPICASTHLPLRSSTLLLLHPPVQNKANRRRRPERSRTDLPNPPMALSICHVTVYSETDQMARAENKAKQSQFQPGGLFTPSPVCRTIGPAVPVGNHPLDPKNNPKRSW